MKTPHLEDPLPASNIRVAVAALMKTLSQENGPYGITANTVATGPFESDPSRQYRRRVHQEPVLKTEGSAGRNE